MTLSATYSPDDNKLRLYSTSRLDRELYDRVKAAGFHWAPKQDLFVAPMWTPERADLLLELCGEIDDEDTSLCERAEERAERFEGYSDKREADAHAARAGVERITSGIPMGQPILVGHHSERHARRDAERIENGMRKAIKMWETSQYWERRAKGALQHAKYKEDSGVRHRRMKGLQADQRRHEKTRKIASAFVKAWTSLDGDKLTKEAALKLANYSAPWGPSGQWSALTDDKMTPAEARQAALASYGRGVAHSDRWLAHIALRLSYEAAMMDEGGGLPACKYDVQVGGKVLVSSYGGPTRQEWVTVVRVNKGPGPGGASIVSSLTTNRRVCRKVGVEEVLGYEPPVAGAAEKVAAATKLPPLVNYPGEGFLPMTIAEYKRASERQYACTRKRKATETHGAHRVRESIAPASSAFSGMKQVFVTDLKVTHPPPLEAAPKAALEAPEPEMSTLGRTRVIQPSDEPKPFEAMKAQLRAGVKVVVAPQLFPTPRDLAARMVELADLQPGHRVLEPSAGTGHLVDAIRATGVDVELVAVEIDPRLAKLTGARCLDFLDTSPGPCAAGSALRDRDIGTFDRIIMNPVFGGGADVLHIEHARRLLRPGGRIVALCANGPRQQKALRGLVQDDWGHWEPLPEGTFKEQGTGVRVVLVVLEAQADRKAKVAS